MAGTEEHLRDLARPRHGVITWREARAAGLSTRTIATRIRQGSWRKTGSTLIMRDLHHPGDIATSWALHLHCGPESCVSGPLALRLQGWDVAGHDHIVVAPSSRRPPEGVSLRIIRRHPAHLIHTADTPPLVPRLEALIDVLSTRSESGAIDLLDRALQRHWIDAGALTSAVSSRVGPGRRHQVRLRMLQQRAATGSRSEAEQQLRPLLQRAGGNWTPNFPLLAADGSVVAEIDFADPELRLAIEVDGRAFHSDRAAFEKDRVRQNMLSIRGWMVLRFTWERIVNDPEGVIAEIRAAISQAIVRSECR